MKYTLNGVSEERFREIARALEKRTGLVLHGHEGRAEMHGFCVGYLFDAASETLHLELLKKPWFVPQSLIDRKVGEFMAGQGREFLGGGR